MVAHNIWDSLPDEPPGEYVRLEMVCDFGDFVYDYTYRDQEEYYLRPQMEEKGYTQIKFYAGESDCYGPLSRLCKALDRNKEPVWFIYG